MLGRELGGDAGEATVDARGRRTSFDDQEQLSVKVAAYLREGIMVGEFGPNEYVRTERLADSLGVSHTPVREALMILTSEGAVKWEPRRGYRVVRVTAGDVRDLFMVQAYIAGELAARAAATLDDDDLDTLDSVQRKLEQAERDSDSDMVDHLNFQIHRLINRASHSTRLASMLNQTVHYVPLRFFGSIDGWAEASAHDHTAILGALRDRDPDAARRAMSSHVEHIGVLLVGHLHRQELLGDS